MASVSQATEDICELMLGTVATSSTKSVHGYTENLLVQQHFGPSTHTESFKCYAYAVNCINCFRCKTQSLFESFIYFLHLTKFEVLYHWGERS